MPTTWTIELDNGTKDMVLTGVTDMAIVVVPWPTKYTLEPDIRYGVASVGTAFADVATAIPVAGLAGKDVTATSLADIRYIAGDAAMGIGPRTHYEPTIGYMFVFGTDPVPQPVVPAFKSAVVVPSHLTNILTVSAGHPFVTGDLVSYHADVYPGGILSNKIYTVAKASDTQFSLVSDGRPVNFTSSPTGTQTVIMVSGVTLPATIPGAVFVPFSWGPRLRNSATT